MDKIKVLFLASNPRGSQLQLDKEVREITAKTRASEYRDSIDFITRWAVTPDDVQQSLLEVRPHILHFSGHGRSSSSAGAEDSSRALHAVDPYDNSLVLMDDNGNAKPVSGQAIKHLLSVLRDNLRLVVLNACYSRPQAEAITEFVDCAVGMNRAIGDEAAILFAGSLYRGLGFGRSIGEAFELGRSALLLEGVAEDKTPELLLRKNVDASSLVLIEAATDRAEQHKPSGKIEVTDVLVEYCQPGLARVDFRIINRGESPASISRVRFRVLEFDSFQGYGAFEFSAEYDLDISELAEVDAVAEVSVAHALTPGELDRFGIRISASQMKKGENRFWRLEPTLLTSDGLVVAQPVEVGLPGS